MENKIGILCIGLLLLLMGGCGKPDPLYFDTEAVVKEDNSAADTEKTAQMADTQNSVCYVYVCGAVGNPGVYPLPSGSRVYEAIEAAGGLLEEAGADCVNQAEPVSDGQMIKVLTAEEAEKNAADTARTNTPEASDGRVNINTAVAAELMTLPGVGESKAESIISYREENGGFDKIEDIMNITGIKEGVFEKIKDDIMVD